MSDERKAIAELESRILKRLDEMTARSIAEFHMTTMPPRADSSIPFEERMAKLKDREDAMIAELKSRQAKREAEKAMWDGRPPRSRKRWRPLTVSRRSRQIRVLCDRAS